MSPLVILMCVAMASSALATLISFRYAVHWTKRYWALSKGKTNHFDDYWEAKNMVRRWENTYLRAFWIMITLVLFSVGLGAFSVAF